MKSFIKDVVEGWYSRIPYVLDMVRALFIPKMTWLSHCHTLEYPKYPPPCLNPKKLIFSRFLRFFIRLSTIKIYVFIVNKHQNDEINRLPYFILPLFTKTFGKKINKFFLNFWVFLKNVKKHKIYTNSMIKKISNFFLSPYYKKSVYP